MLISLAIKHFVWIDELTVPFHSGMTALTGETGAGKSILCDALWFVLGAAADKNVIALNQSSCEIKVTFNIEHHPDIQAWLIEQNYVTDSNVTICHITRRLSREGRHPLWINQKVATVKAVRWLQSRLVERHSQHDQQRLLNHDYQRQCLDAYGQYTQLIEAVEQCYQQYKNTQQEKQRLLHRVEKQKDHLKWLRYQLDELDGYALKPNELTILDQKQRQLSHAHTILEKGQVALLSMSESDSMSLFRLITYIQQIIQTMMQLDARFESVASALERANLEIVEAESELRFVLSRVTVDPVQLSEVNQRLEKLHALARKHQLPLDDLPTVADRLEKECQQHENDCDALAACENQLKDALNQYRAAANSLSQARYQTADSFQKGVTQIMQGLGMSGGQFTIQLIPQDINIPTAFGNERVVCSLSASPGQPLQILSKGASGGELSRLALIIQSLIIKKTTISTIIFDEVDVGVGGEIAERMGHLLKEMSTTRQVVCITHLPQVAALADSHYLIQKESDGKKTMTKIKVLDNIQKRIQEIARMSGGINVTDQTIAYAKSMLQLESDH